MRAKAVGLLEAGWSLSKVAEAVGSPKSGVSRIKARLRVKGEEVTVKGDFGKGRKEAAIKPRQAAWLKEASKVNPFKSAAQLKRQAGSNSPLAMVPIRRIRESLQRQGLHGRKAAKKPLLTPRMVEARLAWCDQHKDWTEEDWLKVEFSDESTFQQFRVCLEIVRRPVGKRLNPSFTKKTVKHPPSVMVWESFDGSVGRGRLFFLPKGCP